jgi:hypothetical protein
MMGWISKRSEMLWLILLPLLLSLACGAFPGFPSSGSDSGSVTVNSNVTFGPGAFTLSDPAAGLAALPSYTATLTVTFDGTGNGQTLKTSRKYVMLASKDPALQQLTIEDGGGSSDLMAEQGGADYEVSGGNSCEVSAAQPGQSLSDRLGPAGFLHFVVGAQPAGNETINGIAADHYTFDERALGQQGLTQSSGELWVASDGGYLVKYVLTAKAGADYFGNGQEGTLTWDYELTGVGKPVTVSLPAECPAGMVNAPLLPDPSNEVNAPGLLSYQTSTGVSDAAAFYQKQIPTLGWKLQNNPEVGATRAFMDFRQPGQEMTVLITGSSGVTDVNILLSRTQN